MEGERPIKQGSQLKDVDQESEQKTDGGGEKRRVKGQEGSVDKGLEAEINPIDQQEPWRVGPGMKSQKRRGNQQGNTRPFRKRPMREHSFE